MEQAEQTHDYQAAQDRRTIITQTRDPTVSMERLYGNVYNVWLEGARWCNLVAALSAVTQSRNRGSTGARTDDARGLCDLHTFTFPFEPYRAVLPSIAVLRRLYTTRIIQLERLVHAWYGPQYLPAIGSGLFLLTAVGTSSASTSQKYNG